MEEARKGCALGRWLARLKPARGTARQPWARLLGASAFLRQGARLRKATRRRGEMLTLAVLEAEDLAEIDVAHGAAVAALVRRALAGKLLAAAGPRGLAASTGGNAFALLVPGVDEDGAAALLRDELGDPLELVVRERTAGGDLIRVVCRPVCMLRLLDADARDLAAWLDDMHEDVALAVRWRGGRDAFSAAMTRALRRSSSR